MPPGEASGVIRHLALLTLLLLMCAGCKGNAPRLVPVRGSVVYRRQPVKAAMVMFIADGSQGTRAPAALAQTSADGSFVLHSPPHGEGAVPGYYKVTLTPGEDSSRVPAKYQ